jgi:hypothetical protein
LDFEYSQKEYGTWDFESLSSLLIFCILLWWEIDIIGQRNMKEKKIQTCALYVYVWRMTCINKGCVTLWPCHLH